MRTVTGNRRTRRTMSTAGALLLAIALSGCGISVPTDPDGTLEHVTGGELRIGASPDHGLVDIGTSTPSGPLPDLAGEFAKTLDASPEWTVGSEETLVGMLEAGDLDLIVGGFTEKTPWIDKAGITRGYSGIPGADGRKIVMLVPLGENAFLSDLERFLDKEVDS
ncbi:hypothetical protein [Microbacterium esteraromaticum]|uniref:hypothetical protein n=1 Tax=Microbacterium esteraromaticum TaxID=57043 RepID=UPI001E190AE7|nr:hypothetical protein [Microbacterium esteraromaticum]MBM7466677.1 ABC-type amino acid transport substrate-binding protein [Microbacterium esteraromaticum]